MGILVEILEPREHENDYYAVLKQEKEPFEEFFVPISQGSYLRLRRVIEARSFPNKHLSGSLFRLIRKLMKMQNVLLLQVEVILIFPSIFFCKAHFSWNQKPWEMTLPVDDGLSLALYFNSEVFLVSEISAGEQRELADEAKQEGMMDTIAGLEEQLSALLKKEDYESAIQVRDAIRDLKERLRDDGK